MISNPHHCSFKYLLIETKGCEHKTEKKELCTTHCGPEDIETATRIEQTSVKERPNLRQLFGTQYPILPRWQRPRRLQISSAAGFGQMGGFSDSTSINPDNVQPLISGSTTLQGSSKSSVYQAGDSDPDLLSLERTPKTGNPWTSLGVITKAQEHQIPPPESKKEDNSDHVSTNDRRWKEVVATIEQSHEADLMDLREDMEALEAKHQEQLLAANSKKLVLQKRVKKLLQQKSEENALREENIRLSNLVASFASRIEESNAVLQCTQDQNEQLECQLLESQDMARLLARNLQKACEASEVYRYRAYQLDYALQQQPCKDADVKMRLAAADEEIWGLRRRLQERRLQDLET